jgi:transposase
METKKDEKVVSRRPKRGNFEIKFIKDVIKEIEEGGLTRREVREKYNIGATSLQEWCIRYGSPEYGHPTRRLYKPTDKRTMLRVYKAGMSKQEITVAFNMNISTLGNWIKGDRKENADIRSTNPTIMPKKAKHTDGFEVKALKQALEQSELKIKALDILIDVAEEQLKINIRKKSGARQS